METNGNNLGAFLGQKGQSKYWCELCDYKCSKKYDWERHTFTAKHKNRANGNILETKKGKKGQDELLCDFCNKKYNNRSGLWKHKQNCKNDEIKTDEIKTDENIMSIFMDIIKQNQDFQKLIVEQHKQIIENSCKNNFITNNTMTDNRKIFNNKTFNMQLFLNEKCKDALNIDEFIDSLKISLDDLENFGENGFVNGVSKIFVNGLKNLDIYKRPIHCSDLKRETMYLKEQNTWEKDNNNVGFKKAIKTIAYKNMLKMKDWKKVHPDYNNCDSKKNDRYLKILMGVAVPYKEEDEENSYSKILKNVAKEVTIDKQFI